MSEQEVRTKLIKIIEEEAQIEADEISQMSSFDGVIDSLTLLEVVYGIEESFGITFEDEQMKALSSLDDAVQLVLQSVPSAELI